MARRTNTYAIRLAVEGGGQVKAELVSVGQSGEQSLKRIESAGERASGGLKGLGRNKTGRRRPREALAISARSRSRRPASSTRVTSKPSSSSVSAIARASLTGVP